MKILMLGGTGAMGVALAPLLVSRGDEVIVTSRKDREGKSIRYIKGDAHKIDFLKSILKEGQFDCIVDFMVYDTAEFRNRIDLLCSCTKQYVFLSSSRVYADSADGIVSELTPRLIDHCTDSEYCCTDDYALTKARQEDLLRTSNHRNWTIIRPYISYNTNRLQLGCFEKEEWLYRALRGRTVVFFKDIEKSTTTMTWGGDVAYLLSKTIGNPKALCEIFNITTDENLKWSDILNIYSKTFKKLTGKEMKILEISSYSEYTQNYNYVYPYKYDRMYHRKFNNHKICELVDQPYRFKKVEEGITESMKKFLTEDLKWQTINWSYEAIKDKMTGERTGLSEITGIKNKIRYLLIRYTSYLKWRTSH